MKAQTSNAWLGIWFTMAIFDVRKSEVDSVMARRNKPLNIKYEAMTSLLFSLSNLHHGKNSVSLFSIVVYLNGCHIKPNYDSMITPNLHLTRTSH